MTVLFWGTYVVSAGYPVNRYLVEGEFEIPLVPGLHLPGAEKGIKGLGQFKTPALTQAQIADREPKVERLFGSAFTP